MPLLRPYALTAWRERLHLFYLLLLNVYGGSDYSASNDKMGGE